MITTATDRVAALEAALADAQQAKARASRRAILEARQPSLDDFNDEIAEIVSTLDQARTQAAWEADAPKRQAAFLKDDKALFAEAGEARKRIAALVDALAAELDRTQKLASRIETTCVDPRGPFAFFKTGSRFAGPWLLLLRGKPNGLREAVTAWQKLAVECRERL